MNIEDNCRATHDPDFGVGIPMPQVMKRLSCLVPDLFPYSSGCTHLPAGSCLLIDPSLKRAIQGINLGFSTAHYVNPRHMERELYLRGFFGRITIHKKPQLST